MADARRVAHRYLLRMQNDYPGQEGGAAVPRGEERTASGENPLDGLPRRKVVPLVNKAIENAHTGGMHRDQYWKPVKAIWKSLDRMGIPYVITKSEYEHERGQQMPVRKVWKFEVPFTNDRGRPTVVYGQVVAAGAGTVEDPLSTYDVVAYAN